MAVERHAEVTWNGGLMEGSGQIDSTGSGAFGGLEVTWASRSEPDESGRTSPEELIAAAHATCFSMALCVRPRERRHAAGAAEHVGNGQLPAR